MKALFLAIAVFNVPVHLYATPELDALDAKVRAVFRASEWEITKDWKSITVTRRNVRFLNPIGLPSLPEDRIWSQFSVSSDYRVTITLTTKLTDAEYRALAQLKHKISTQRTAGIADAKEAFGAGIDADQIIQLPVYYLDRFSVYLYTSDDNFFKTRPASVATARDKLVAILDTSCKKYAKADAAKINENADR